MNTPNKQHPSSGNLWKAFLIATLVAVTGCSSEDGGLIGTGTGPSPTDTQTALKFVGTYTSPCVLEDSGDPQTDIGATYSVIQVNLGENSGTDRQYFYTDEGCTAPATPAEAILEYLVVYPGGTQETPLGTADFINVTLQTVTVDGQLLSEQALEIFGDFGGLDTVYHLYLLAGNLLYTGAPGAEFDGTTEARRFNRLDSTPLLRQ